MATECFKHLRFSSMSDIWAYGVMVWEVFTMGQVPFAERRLSSHFKRELESGLRLEKPKLATQET